MGTQLHRLRVAGVSWHQPPPGEDQGRWPITHVPGATPVAQHPSTGRHGCASMFSSC